MTDLEYLNSPEFFAWLKAFRPRFQPRWESLMEAIGQGYQPSEAEACQALNATRDQFLGWWAILETSRAVIEGPNKPFGLKAIFGERDAEALITYGSDGDMVSIEFVRSLAGLEEAA